MILIGVKKGYQLKMGTFELKYPFEPLYFVLIPSIPKAIKLFSDVTVFYVLR